MKIRLKEKPKKDIYKGLFVVFEKDTETETIYGYSDIVKGQTIYEIETERKIFGIYQKIK